MCLMETRDHQYLNIHMKTAIALLELVDQQRCTLCSSPLMSHGVLNNDFFEDCTVFELD